MTGLDTDTIAAIATARGNGPVGIIRLSGPNALAIAIAAGHDIAPFSLDMMEANRTGIKRRQV